MIKGEIYNRELPKDLLGRIIINVDIDICRNSSTFTYIVCRYEATYNDCLIIEIVRLKSATLPEYMEMMKALADHWNAYLLYLII